MSACLDLISSVTEAEYIFHVIKKVFSQPRDSPYPEIVLQGRMGKVCRELWILLCFYLTSESFRSYMPTFFVCGYILVVDFGFCCIQLPSEASEKLALTLQNVLSPLHTSTLQIYHK